MKFHRVSVTAEGGSDGGTFWFTTKRAALRLAADWVRDNPGETAQLSVVDIPPTKAGILRALLRYASEPRNG